MNKLRDIMTPDVEVVSPEDSLHHAAERMRDRDVGALPVCDGDLATARGNAPIVHRTVEKVSEPRATHAAGRRP